MEAAVLLWFHLLLSVIFCNGFHVQGPSGSLTVQLGDSVMLPCFVETPLPMEELEVEWNRIDSGSLVHLWQNGESRPESQNQRYHERANFFSEEVAHGNFSLLLTNVTREDAGVYKCVIHTNQHSDETLIEMEFERLVVSGAHIISAYAGEDITLNCSVDSHIPSEKIEEVSWKKRDEDLLLLLYLEGDILTELTHERFKGRVEFFSTEDRNKGNFSMRLKDVRTEDKGLYICSAFSGTLSDNTTVEVQRLGFSSMHIGIIVLCLLGFAFGSVILGYFSYTSFKKKYNRERHLDIQYALVLCPNITLSIGFILWGVTEGLFTEAATCSALNFVRICFLFWIALHLVSFEDYVHPLIKLLAVPIQYFMIIAVVYIPIIVNIWHKINTGWKVGMLILFLPGPVSAILFVSLSFCFHYRNKKAQRVLFIVKGLEILFASLFTFSVYGTVNVEERDALICVTVFFIILSVMNISFYYISTQNEISESLYPVVVFLIGSVLIVFVNAAALLVELILKARTGQRTVDLRLIVIPTEIVFAVFLFAVQISVYCKEKKKSSQRENFWILAPVSELRGS